MTNSKHYFWSAINQIVTQILGFIGNILIARILSPDDYGLVAMLSIIIGIAWNLTESGLGDYLIRKCDADKKDFGVVLTYNVVISFVIYVVLHFLAPFIAEFFKREELVTITRILSLSIIFKALTVTEFTRMRKALEFKNFTIISILSSILSIALAFAGANIGMGYYALVIQTVSLAVINMLLIVVVNKWRPYFYFNWERYKEMRGFSGNMLFSYFTNQIGQNIYSVFIGKYQSVPLLGYFNQATKVNDASFQGLNSIILTTSYPIIAKERDRSVRRKKYIELTKTFLSIHFFASFLIIGSASELIPFLFGEKWMTASGYLQLITLSTLFSPIMTINANIVKTENKTEIYRNLTFLRNGLTLVSLLITFKISMIAILIGLIIARYISVIVDVLFCGHKIDFGFNEQLKIVLVQMTAPVIAMATAYYSATFFEVNFIKLGVFFTVYTAIFLLVNVIIENPIQKTILKNIKGRIARKKNNH